MSHSPPVKALTAKDIEARKGGTPIVCLTAYTTPVAQIVDAECDVVLVGDSVGMVLHGLASTVPVTMEMMIMHGQAVARGLSRALMVVDMPFGSYEESPAQAFANAALLLGCRNDLLNLLLGLADARNARSLIAKQKFCVGPPLSLIHI